MGIVGDVADYQSIHLFRSCSLGRRTCCVTESAGGGTFFTQTVIRLEEQETGDPLWSYSGPDPDEIYVNNGQNQNSWQLQVQVRYEHGPNIF